MHMYLQQFPSLLNGIMITMCGRQWTEHGLNVLMKMQIGQQTHALLPPNQQHETETAAGVKKNDQINQRPKVGGIQKKCENLPKSENGYGPASTKRGPPLIAAHRPRPLPRRPPLCDAPRTGSDPRMSGLIDLPPARQFLESEPVILISLFI